MHKTNEQYASEAIVGDTFGFYNLALNIGRMLMFLWLNVDFIVSVAPRVQPQL